MRNHGKRCFIFPDWLLAAISGLLVAALGWVWRLSAILSELRSERHELQREMNSKDKAIRSQLGIHQINLHYRLQSLEICVDSIEKYLETRGDYTRRPRPQPPSPGDRTGADFFNHPPPPQ